MNRCIDAAPLHVFTLGKSTCECGARPAGDLDDRLRNQTEELREAAKSVQRRKKRRR